MEAAPLPRARPRRLRRDLRRRRPVQLQRPAAGEVAGAAPRRARSWRALLDEVVARDFPFFGACYGVGTLGVHQGGVIDRTYAEPISAVRVRLTEDGRADPVLAGMAGGVRRVRRAQGGVQRAAAGRGPARASAACPVQMFRVKQNLYATQFHPELDLPGLLTRVRVYQHAGYFPPAELDDADRRASAPAVVTEPGRMLANFVARYG